MGEYLEMVFMKHVQESIIKKGVPSWGSQDRHHLAQVECARQSYDLDRVSFIPVSQCGRPGFRIDSRTIKRGSRVSNLFVSFRESSNLCILGIIFIGSYLAFFPCEVLELVVILMTSSSSSKTDFLWKTCCVFGVWRIYRFLI
jgi:hypothetical protein